MRPSSTIFILILALSATGLAAQTATPGASSTVFIAPPASQSCPVNFSAKREPNSGLVAVARSPQPNASPGQISQGVHITFEKSPSPGILKVDVSVHGMSGRGGMIPAAATDVSTETFQFSGSPSAPLLSSSVWTRQMSAVSWIELTRIEFANGTVWQSSPTARCAAAPSLFVLVDSGH